MSDQTKIQWANKTFNPWMGCTMVSEGCIHCYMGVSTPIRVLRAQGRDPFGKGKPRTRTSEATWREPVKWNKMTGEGTCSDCHTVFAPIVWASLSTHSLCTCGGAITYHSQRIFPSLCDWLDDEVPIEWLADFLKLIHDTPNLDWLLLTKRPENWKLRLEKCANLFSKGHYTGWMINNWHRGIAPDNVWLGTSCENQATADERIPELLKIPAKVRFLSVEPMLEAVDFKKHIPRFAPPHGQIFYEGISWAIFGGESGPNARPCNIEWIRDGVRQCQTAGVAAFVKQMGGNLSDYDLSECSRKSGRSMSDRKGGDMAEWPEYLRVREFPKV